MIIRIWDGCAVRYLLDISQNGSGSASSGATGGAAHSGKVDIELDPWAGLIVDHRHEGGPVAWRDYEKDIDEAHRAGQRSMEDDDDE